MSAVSAAQAQTLITPDRARLLGKGTYQAPAPAEAGLYELRLSLDPARPARRKKVVSVSAKVSLVEPRAKKRRRGKTRLLLKTSIPAPSTGGAAANLALSIPGETPAGPRVLRVELRARNGKVRATDMRLVPQGPAAPQPDPSDPTGDPVAFDWTVSGAPLEGGELTFSAASDAPPGSSYRWEFGDGASVDGPTASHAFPDNGSFVVTALVRAPDGRSASATRTVVVVNVEPVVVAGGPYTGLATLPVRFQATGADPGPADGPGLDYTWEFGDGAAGAGASVAHVYQAPGTYTARVTVRDKDGGSATATAAVEVREFDGSSGVVVTPDLIVTPHDVIPNFAGHPTLAAARSGPWSDPLTWGGRLPAAGEVVSVGGGATVTYDLAGDVEYDTVAVQAGGTLRFRTDVNTRLRVTNLLVMEGGTLTVGTVSDPVEASVKAEIIFNDVPINTAVDPSQYGNGLIALGNVSMHGAVLSDTFVRLAVEPKAGDTTLTLATPVRGWKAGDRLLLPDSRQTSPTGNLGAPGDQLELLTVQSLSTDGGAVTLTAPLQHPHVGARDSAGTLDFLPHVANRTRNVVVRSENARGTRGHTFYTARADVDVRYAQFSGLGRSKVDPFNDTTYDSTGAVIQVGTNQRGRYAVHFHHLVGPAVTPSNGNQFTFAGNSVLCPIEPMPFRWGIALHDSHYGLIKDNVLYNWAGAALVTENGSESYNVIAHNFSAGTSAPPGLRADFRGVSDMGFEGTAFWFRGPNNYVRDNVAVNAYQYGFGYVATWLGAVKIPAFPGADPSREGQSVEVGMNGVPLLEFARNEAYGLSSGMQIWWIGAWGLNPVPSVAESVIKDFRVWHHTGHGVYGYETSHLTVDGIRVRGSLERLNYYGDTLSTGVFWGDYLAHNTTVVNADIQNTKVGVNVSTLTNGSAFTLKNSYLRNFFNVEMQTLWTSGYNADFIPPRTVVVDNVRFGPRLALDGDWFGPQLNLKRGGCDGMTRNLVQSDQIFVSNYNGVAGDNFRLYALEQAADHELYQTVANSDGTPQIKGSPVAGLTNLEAWTRYGIAFGGELAPATARPAPGITGLVAPF